MKNIILKIILPLILLGALAVGGVCWSVYRENKKLEELAAKIENGGEYLKQIKEEKKKLWDLDGKNDNEARFNIAVLKNILGDKDGALKEYLTILSAGGGFASNGKNDPKNTKVLNNIADIYQDKAEWGKAEEYYKKLLAADPSFIPAYRNLGNLYRFRLGNDEAEIKELIDRGLGYTNDNPDLLGWIIAYYQETGQAEKSLPYGEKLVEQLENSENK